MKLIPKLRVFWLNQTDDGIFNQIFKLDGECYRQQKNRKTLRVKLGTAYYFLKRHDAMGWREVLKNIIKLRTPTLGARAEWQAIKKLNALNIPTTPLAGYGERGKPPAHLQSFIITEEISNAISLEDFCRDWPAQAPPLHIKQALIAEVARIARILHSNGINHRDFYICHFLLDQTQPLTANKIKLYIIDLHRAQLHNKTPRRAIIKDLSALYFSTLDIGLTSRDLLRFIKHYTQQPLKQCLQQTIWRTIIKRAFKLYRKIRQKNLFALATLQAFSPFWLSGETRNTAIQCEQLIRVIPRKRWVFFARWQNQLVVAKLFRQPRHAMRELLGHQLLTAAKIMTPPVLFHGWLLEGDFYCILYQRIYPAQDFASQWENANLQKKQQLLQTLLTATAKLHQAGIKQQDFHFGNFLLTPKQQIYTLDPADMVQCEPLSERASFKNLAMLFAQLPLHYTYSLEEYYRLYLQQRNIAFTTRRLQQLKKWIVQWQMRRLQMFGRKVLRSSTAFICRRSWRQFSVCDRAYDTEAMRLFLAGPETILQGPVVKKLKAGNTCTVMLIELSGHKLVVKRYNIKNFWHRLKRAVQPTRAMISWRNAQRLSLLNFPTAKPVALLEQRFGPLRSTSYFITEYVAGLSLQDYLINTPSTEERLLVSEKIMDAFKQLTKIRISHGDLKATNILMAGSQPIFLDLDAMRLHHYTWTWQKAQQKDWQRFLKNWQDQPEIKEIFEEINHG